MYKTMSPVECIICIYVYVYIYECAYIAFELNSSLDNWKYPSISLGLEIHGEVKDITEYS